MSTAEANQLKTILAIGGSVISLLVIAFGSVGMWMMDRQISRLDAVLEKVSIHDRQIAVLDVNCLRISESIRELAAIAHKPKKGEEGQESN